MIRINPSVWLDEAELRFDFIRSTGPGGQNINKVATAVQLRWDVGATEAIPEDDKKRLIKLAGKRINAEGVLVIEARRYRSQERNRQDALDRLVKLVQRALEPPRIRRPTRPSVASRERRLREKKKRGDIKRLRKTPPEQ